MYLSMYQKQARKAICGGGGGIETPSNTFFINALQVYFDMLELAKMCSYFLVLLFEHDYQQP